MKFALKVWLAILLLPVAIMFGELVVFLIMTHPWVALGVAAVAWAARQIKEERAVLAASAPPAPPARQRSSRFGCFLSYLCR